MKQLLRFIVLSFLALLINATVNGQSLSGIVFRDFNGNGQKNNSATFNEPFVSGITVRAFNAGNVQVGPAKTTDASGAYSFTTGEIPNGTAVRVEFTGLGTGDYSSFNGTQNSTNVQFVTTGAGVTANYAINAPDDYWNNTIETNPVLAVVQNHRGRNDGYYSGNVSLLQLNNNTQSTSPPANSASVTIDTGQTTAARRATSYAQTGSTFGLAYQQKSQRTFQTAVLKRGHGFGPQGSGGIYIATKGATYLTYSGSFTLQGVTPSNGGGALDFGTVTRRLAVNPAAPTAAELADDNYLSGRGAFDNPPSYANSDSRDMNAFAKVGTMSYGDIEADKATDKLYTINLFQRRLIVLDVENTPTATLNGASASTLSPLVRAYDMTTLPGWPTVTGAGNVLRPYGIKIYKGVGYVGVVSDGSATQSETDVDGYVLSFNPNNITAGFTTVLTIDFNNYGLLYGFQSFHMGPWVSTWAQAITRTGAGAPGPEYYAQPMIAGFEFNEDGSMDIAIRDRWGDQGCSFEYIPVAGSTTAAQTVTMGDLLHATKNGSGWLLESNTTQPAANTIGNTATNSFGDGSSFGSTGKEYYADRSGDGQPDNNQAGITKLMGTERIVTTVVDPIAQGAAVGSIYWSTQGLQWNNTTTGNKTQWARTIGDASSDKSNGMGDVEFLIASQPIQIGNRIWSDANGNGIQDAGETTAGVPTGTTVTLRSPGADGVYGNGDDQTWTTTTDANGNYYFSALSSADNRRPASWTGVGNTILPGYEYRVEVAVPAGYQVTGTDILTNGYDLIDNDASLNGSNAVVVFNTANTNHNFDIGFKNVASLGDKVWRDDDKDGIQDAGEPGVAGVTVTLYQNGTDGNPGTADDIIIGTTVTDAYGNYLFSNLAPSTTTATSYNVGFTLPANYQFTTQTNTQVTGTSDATNTTTTSGGSTAANGSDANTTTGRTGSFWLAPSENELGVDAGIVFTQPTTNSIGDKVWFDTDGDGVQDTNEAGVSGVTITLYASDGVTVLATTVTDANGNYIFTGLNANTNYIVGLTPPAGMLLTTTSGTTSGNATTNSDFSQTTYKTTAVNSGTAGTQITGIDAGLVMQSNVTASLGDKVWLDLNGNNIQDAGEPGVAGVTVNLYRDANADGLINGAEAATPYATTVTDVFGNYIFNNLPATASGAAYQAGFVLPSGYSFVSPNSGGDDFKDSDANTFAGGYTGLYFLKQGQRNLSVDAGLIQTSPAGTASLGDKVWYDADADGIQDAGETGVSGVTVTLYNNAGTAIATTTTDANGNYLFANLAAGDYSVGFSNLPQGYSLTPTWSSNDANTTNSDANPATGRTGSITLSAGEQELDVDAGLVAGVPSGLASLGNKVWWDVVTANNTQDAGEPGVAGVTVNLYKDANGDGLINGAEASTPVATTATNALGEYMFTGLTAGTYQVGFTDLPTGSNTVTQNSGANDAIDSDGSAVTNATSGSVSTTGSYTLATGEENLTVDLGIINTAKGALGNRVWYDNGAGGGTANDGIQNGSEIGVAGVMVTLVNASGQLVDRNGNVTTTPVVTTTDANGYYVFADLTAGASFAVKFSNLPTGFDYTAKTGTGSGDDNRSDADIVNGLTPAVTIVANTLNTTLDGGITSTRASLGNYVWMDDNGDGVQDSGEPGVAGVTVSLYYDANSDGDFLDAGENLPVASMITDQNGSYLFTNLIPGNYQVEFSTIPGGTTFTQRNTPGDNGDNTNSDAVPQSGNIAVGRTATVVLSAGEADLTVDAGLFRPRAVIGNYVWVDSNNDGVQQSTEPPAPGILVSLIDAGGNVVAVAVTDGNGSYLFPNVAPGTYSMSFTNRPTGTSFTSANAGDDNFDSDVSAAGIITGIIVTTTTVNLSFDAGIVGFVTLPAAVNLIAVKSGNTAILNWTVSAERNVKSYTLQRSGNGTQYTDVVSYAADGRTAYNKVDAQPLGGINYYRVRIENADVSISYSEVKMVRFDAKGVVTVFPNPATDNVNIQLPDNWQGHPARIDVIALSGQVLITKSLNAANQVEAIRIDHLPAGIYHLRIAGNNKETIIKKVEKK